MSTAERRTFPALLAGLALLLLTTAGGSAQPVAGAQAWQEAAAAKIRPRFYRSIAGRWPAAAVRVVVRFTVDRAGRVSSVALARSSGSRRFDRAALAAVRGASPLSPPDWTGRDRVTFSQPIQFDPDLQPPSPGEAARTSRP